MISVDLSSTASVTNILADIDFPVRNLEAYGRNSRIRERENFTVFRNNDRVDFPFSNLYLAYIFEASDVLNTLRVWLENPYFVRKNEVEVVRT